MGKNIALCLLLFILPASFIRAQQAFDYAIETSEDSLQVHVLGHASVTFEWDGLQVYVDPYSKVYDFSGKAKADLILITHEHSDHFDTKAIDQVIGDSTILVYTATCQKTHSYSGHDTVMANGDSSSFLGIGIEAVPAYNRVKSRHDKGVGNGYVLTFGDKRVYIAGDTEVIPEMDSIRNIDLAFMGFSSFNMDEEMFLEALHVIQPKVVIPYHYDSNNISELVAAVKSQTSVVILTEAPVVVPNYASSLSESRYLYPNPTKNRLYCSALKENSTVWIYSLSGRLISKEVVAVDGMLNIGSLSPGVYFFKVENSENRVPVKFVVEQ